MEFSLADRFFYHGNKSEDKGGAIVRTSGSIGRFGWIFASSFSGIVSESLSIDMRSKNRLPWVIGRDGTWRLHLPIAKFPDTIFIGFETRIHLSEMRNGVANRIKTTW